jgi:hypothetical protein
MSPEGPVLDRLTHRLSDCPASCLQTPRTGKADGVHVDAVVHDLIVMLGGPPPARDELSLFAPSTPATQRVLSLVLVASWLLHDDWFGAAGTFASSALTWLQRGLTKLAELVSPELFVRDPDRREELVRLCLAALGLRAAGETEAQADDRLRALDSAERVRLLRDTHEQQERARRLREAMRKKEAAEAAAKVSREW